ncbi:serine/threonine-protein kinase [Fontibacillus solani]|uniref:non-specific serine/threonine protein kinase n=1 Tax=Fontibacillus solani TaxID=1572857 RepID=A0A7W3SPX0_9BACL|nr:serine/threonine-protein kinase [Fontibacillus solani]MBA9084070.1 serine/threonine-protein kinase [Fontibacillus solani]
MTLESGLVKGAILAQRYQIEHLIGIGGMSRVYLASDLKLPGKRWAIKESAVSANRGDHLAEEAEVLISLQHHRLPHIVDFFYLSNTGFCYLVMDFIEGVHLDKYVMGKGGLSFEELIKLGVQICEGLQYLHDHQPPIIHRDLKPSNLLINSKLEITFIDFGIARTYKEASQEDTVKLGTVGFAAPEQYGGKQSDGRADLYSLGALLLYLGTDCQYTLWSDDADKRLRNKGFAHISLILCRLLRTSPEDRFNSAHQTAEALKLLLQTSQKPSDRSFAVTTYRRPFVIAVMGTGPGIGVTHLSIAIAHLLSRRAERVAIIELDPKSTAFTALSEIFEAEKGIFRNNAKLSHLQNKGFQIKGVQYIRSPARNELLALFSDYYEFVICDLGSGRRKECLEEFQRADLSLLVCSGAEWRQEELVIFADQFKDVNAASKWICCVPFGRKEIVRQLRKTSGIKEVYSFPAEEDPFSPSGLTEEVFMEVCGDALPQNIIQQRSGFGLGRKRWRRNN